MKKIITILALGLAVCAVGQTMKLFDGTESTLRDLLTDKHNYNFTNLNTRIIFIEDNVLVFTVSGSEGSILAYDGSEMIDTGISSTNLLGRLDGFDTKLGFVPGTSGFMAAVENDTVANTQISVTNVVLFDDGNQANGFAALNAGGVISTNVIPSHIMTILNYYLQNSAVTQDGYVLITDDGYPVYVE